MKYYFAPMEGITGYIFRNAYEQHFAHIDTYYTPFITPTQTKKLTSRELNDTLPFHNQGIRVVPQILSNKTDEFLWAAKNMQELGYDEVNLNLGCPSKTVVTKKRGAGFLTETLALNSFLNQVSEGLQRINMDFSIKTRIGKDEPEEFETLLAIYNQYPLKTLIIHPRIQTDYYSNSPNWNVFEMALEKSKNPVCYNGDLFSVSDIKQFRERFPQVNALMLGRGLLTNPALPAMAEEAVSDGLSKEKLRAFHDTILAEYSKVLCGDRNTLFKMKELWFYLRDAFADSKKQVKKLQKADKLCDYERTVDAIFAECEIKENPVFSGGR